MYIFDKQKPCGTPAGLCHFAVNTSLCLAEFILAYAAQRADIIVGKILERYAAVLFGVIDIAADVAYILFHVVSPLQFIAIRDQDGRFAPHPSQKLP